MSSRSSELPFALGRWQGVLRENVPLAPSTHLRVGGPARWFAEPWSEEDVAVLVRVVLDLELELLPLGGGSNLLIADEGVDAVVVNLERMNRIVREKNRITAQAGVSLPGAYENR